jgi:hypothetical protein
MCFVFFCFKKKNGFLVTFQIFNFFLKKSSDLSKRGGFINLKSPKSDNYYFILFLEGGGEGEGVARFMATGWSFKSSLK